MLCVIVVLYNVLQSGPALSQLNQMLPIGSQAGVVYSRLFNYTQQAAGVIQRTIGPRTSQDGVIQRTIGPHTS
jgi:hypothetical protein